MDQFDIPHLTLDYEDLFEEKPDSPIRVEPLQEIAEFAGFEPNPNLVLSATRRTSSTTYRNEITNFDDLLEAIQDPGLRSTLLAG